MKNLWISVENYYIRGNLGHYMPVLEKRSHPKTLSSILRNSKNKCKQEKVIRKQKSIKGKAEKCLRKSVKQNLFIRDQ